MNCPYCVAGAAAIPLLAPIVCESCAEIGLLDKGIPRKLAPGELEQIKESPAWRDVIEPARKAINAERAKRS